MENTALDAVVRDYDAGIFQRLNDFHVARDFLEETRESLAQLGDVICLHGLHRHIGVSLLHKHFEIADDEIVVREFADNVSYIKPRKVDRLNPPVPYLWKADISGPHASFYPLEFCDYPEQLKDEARRDVTVLNNASAFLTAFANRLAGLGLIEVFGLASLRSRGGFALEPEETLLETTDEKRRVLTLRPVPASELEGRGTTQTLWIYQPAPSRVGAVIAGATCATHCAGHCLAHSSDHA